MMLKLLVAWVDFGLILVVLTSVYPRAVLVALWVLLLFIGVAFSLLFLPVAAGLRLVRRLQ